MSKSNNTHTHLKGTLMKLKPFKDLIKSNIRCKFEVKWKRRTEVMHF